MDTKINIPVSGESIEESVYLEKKYDCELCNDTGLVNTRDEDGTRECPHIAEAKMEEMADTAWKERDTDY